MTVNSTHVRNTVHCVDNKFFLNTFQMQLSKRQLILKQTIPKYVLVELVDLFALELVR